MWIIEKKNLLLVFLIAITSAIYLPGFSGEFNFDDEWNILQNSSLVVEELTLDSLTKAAESGRAGPLGRPIAMASFAINYYFSGFDPFFFKLTNLIIHIFTGLGIFFLSMCFARQISSSTNKKYEYLALLTTAFWLLHPLNLTPVLYVVQRMSGLSALFVFWGLACYTFGRIRLNACKPYAYLLFAVSFLVFLPLGLLSKENAALFTLYCFLIEFVFFQFKAPKQQQRIALFLGYFICLILPMLCIIVYLMINPDWLLNGYLIRSFDLIERLMTETRILMFYLKEIILPINSELGLFHDDILVSKSLFSPITTIFSILLTLALLISALWLRIKKPVYSFAVLFFFAAHLIESTALGLELVHEHRNYVAIFSVLFFIAFGLMTKVHNINLLKIKYGIIFLALVYLSFTTFMRASVWGNQNLHTFEELRNHPNSPRINYQVGKLFATQGSGQEDNDRKQLFLEKAVFYFAQSAEFDNDYTDGLFGLLMLQGIEGIQMSERYRALLLNSLGNGPFNSNNYNYLSAYFKCIHNGVCSVSVDEVQAIILACETNAGFNGHQKRNILALYSAFNAQHKNAANAAKELNGYSVKGIKP